MFIIINDRGVYRFQSSQIVIGRSKSCDLILDRASISDEQCKLTRDHAGVWWVSKLGPNPTLVNRSYIPANRMTRVGPSDEITVGEYMLQVRDSDRGGAVARALRMTLF